MRVSQVLSVGIVATIFLSACTHVYEDMGKRYEDSGDLTSAVDTYKKAVDENPNSYKARMLYGSGLMKQKKIADAVQQFREAVKLESSNPEARVALGRSLHESNQSAEAKKELSMALALDKTNAEAHYELGRMAQKQNDLKEGIAQYTEATKLNPDFAEAFHDLGLALGLSGDAEGARKALDAEKKIKEKQTKSK